MSLDYLAPFEKKCDLPSLIRIKEEREQWWDRKSPMPYKDILDSLEETNETSFIEHQGYISFKENLSEANLKAARDLMPWKKGPFRFGDTSIDSEWRSDLKWERLKEHIPSLEGKVILDIGCANGYFLYRMAEQNPRLALGIDPVLHPMAQFRFVNHFARKENLQAELFGVEHLKHFKDMFDVIFSMGILYHHRDPLGQLREMKDAMAPGGTLVLETIGIPGDENLALTPDDRYACMRNVWFLPTLPCLITWLERCKYTDIKVVSTEWGECEEQRVTEWSGEKSLSDFLDPGDPSKTVEGHPAPKRFILTARKK